MASKNVKKVPMYIRNVSKSLIYSGQSFLSATMPNVSDFTETNADLLKSISSDLRNYKSIYKQAKTWWNSSSYMGDLKDLKKNVIEDLKTGNFYNKDRAGKEAFKAMGWDDVFSGFDELDSGVDFDSTNDTVTTNAINTNTEATVNVMSAVGTTVANSVATSAEYVAKNQNNIASQTMVNNVKIFNEVNNALVDISTTLHGIFDYTKETSKFFDATMKMQEQIKNLNAEMTAFLKESTEMKRNQYKEYTKSLEDKYKSSDTDDFMTGNIINISDYFKTVFKRAKNELENSDIGTMMAMSGSQGVNPVKLLASNPLSFISNAAFNKMVSKELRKSMEDIDKTLGSFFKSSLLKMGTALRMKGEDTGSGMFDTLYRILGINTRVPTKMRTDLYVKNAVPFNGMTNRAIVEVIPTYLRKILSAITNQEEMIYDYDIGKFNKITDVKKSYDNEIDSSYSGIMSMQNEIKGMTKALGLNNDEQMKLDKDIKSFFRFVVDNSWFINPNKDKFETYQAMGLDLEGREETFNIIKNALAAKGRSELNKFNDDIINTNRQRLYNVDNLTKNGQQKGYTGLVNGFSNNVHGRDGVRLKTGLFVTDKYDNSLFDYLRTIRNTLLEGIRVYTSGGMTEETNNKLNQRFNDIVNADMSSIRRMEIPVETPQDYKKTADEIAQEARRLGSRAFGTLSEVKLSDMGQRNIFKHADEINRLVSTEDTQNQNTIMDRVNNSKIGTGIRGIFDAGKELASVPGRLIKDTLDTINDNMLTFLYGPEGENERTSMFDGIILRINKFGEKITKTITDHVITPLNKVLFDEDKGIMTKFRNWITPLTKKISKSLFDENTGIITKIKNSTTTFLFGDENNTGALTATKNSFLDIKDEFINVISGKGYTSRTTGKVHAGREENVISIFKNTFASVKQGIGDMFKSAKGSKLGSSIKDRITNRIDVLSGSLSRTLFGDSSTTNAKDLYNRHIKDRIPRTLVGGTVGLGLSLFTPLGLIGGLMVGMTGGMLSTSSRFTTAVFGELGSEKRMKYENFISTLKQAAPKMGIGAVLGGLSSFVTPFGFVGSSIIGATAGYLSSSEKFKTWLLGDETREGKISKEWQDKFKSAYPRALVGSGLGLIGSFFTPLGPIGGAVTGLAIGIASMSDKVKTWMFGSENPETGKRQGGIFGKFKLWFKAEIAQPFITFTKSILNEGLYFFRKSMLNPILDALAPIKKEMSLIKDAIFERIGQIKDSIVEKFNNRVIRPFGETMDKYVLTPMKNTFKNLFSGIWKAMKNIITAPSNIINSIGNSLYKKHKANSVADYETEWIKSKNKRNADTEKAYRDRKIQLKAEKDKNKLARNLMRKGNFDINDPATQRGMIWLNMETNKSASSINNNTEKTNSILDNIKDIFDDFKSKWDKDKDNRQKILDKLNDILPKRDNKKNNDTTPEVLDTDDITNNKEERKTSNPINNDIKNNDTTPDVLDVDNNTSNNNNSNKNTGFILVNDIPSNNGTNKNTGFILVNDTPSNNGTNKNTSLILVNDVPNNNNNNKSNKNTGFILVNDTPDNLFDNQSGSNNALILNMASDISTLANNSDQYNGVGYNTEMIANILIDQFGKPSVMPGGAKGIVSKAKGFLSSILGPIGSLIKAPFKIIAGLKEAIVTPIKVVVKGIFDAISAIPKAIVKVGSEVLKTTLSMIRGVGEVAASAITSVFKSLPAIINTLGTVISQTTKVVGAVAVEFVKGIGSVTNTMIKATGSLITGFTKLAAETLPFVAKTLVSTVSVIGSAIGKVVGGTFSLVKGLIFGKNKMKSDKTIKRIDNVMTVETVNKVISLEAINDKRIYESLGNIVTAVHQLRTGTDDMPIHDSATKEQAGKNITDKGAQGVKNVVINMKEAANKIQNKKKAQERNKPSTLNMNENTPNNVINFPSTGNKQVDTFKNKERTEALVKKANIKNKLENKSMMANIGTNKIMEETFGKKGLFRTIGSLLLTGLPMLFGAMKNIGKTIVTYGSQVLEKYGSKLITDILKKLGKRGLTDTATKAGTEFAKDVLNSTTKNSSWFSGFKSGFGSKSTRNVSKNGFGFTKDGYLTVLSQNPNTVLGIGGEVTEQTTKRSIFSKAKGAVKTVAEKANSSIIQKVLNSAAVKKLAGSKIGSILGKLSTFIMARMKTAGSHIFAKIAAKWSVIIGSGAASAGIIPALWYGGEIINGISKTNQIFGMSPSYKPSMLMRTIAGFSEFLSMNLTLGFVSTSTIANFIGALLLTDKDREKIKAGQEQLDKDYEKYMAETGTEISKDEYNEKIANRSLAGKVWDGTKNIAKKSVHFITNDTPLSAFNNTKIRSVFNLSADDDITLGQRVSQGIAGNLSMITGGFIDSAPLARKINKVFTFAGEIWDKTWDGIQEHSILGAFDTERVRNTFGLSEGVNVTLSQRVAQGLGGSLSVLTGGLVDTSSIARTIDGVFITAGEIWDKVWNGIQEHSVLAAFNDDKIRESLGLSPDEKITLADRIAAGLGGTLSGLTGVSIDINPITKTVSKVFDIAGNVWNSVKTFFTDLQEKIKEKFKNARKKLNWLLGEDEDENTSSTDTTKKESIFTKGKNYVTGIFDNMTKYFQDKSKAKSNEMNNVVGGAGDENSSMKFQYRKPKSNEFGMYRTMTNGGMGDSEMQNGAVYYSQNAEPWASVDYGGGKNISQAGCGPTSAAMLLSSVTGQTVTPTEAAQYSLKTGHRIIGNGTDWGFFGDIGSQYGVTFTQTADYNMLSEALAQGRPAILSGKGSAPFTKGGHFVMAVGLDSNGNIIINDPVSKERSKAYPFEQIASSAAQAWISDKTLTGQAVSSGDSSSNSSNSTNTTSDSTNPFTKAFSDLTAITSGFITDGIRGEAFNADKWLETNVNNNADASANSGGTMGGTYGSLVVPSDIAVGTKPLSEDVLRYASAFDSAGSKYGIDSNVLKAISMQESGGNVNANNGYALGLMQIENTLADEFASFGRSYDGNSWSLSDRADPNKAIPFAANRLSEDLKHYSGDYLKTIQAYNFSKYSLDMLIKRYGDEWRSHTAEMGSINGVGNPYGDKDYIPHVLQYYHNGGSGDEFGNSSKMTNGGMGNPKLGAFFGKYKCMKNGGSGNENVITEVKEPTVDFSSFTSTNDYKLSETINDFLTAKELASSNNIVGESGFAKLLALIEKIAINTDTLVGSNEAIKDNTSAIANKQVNNTTTNNTQINSNSGNSINTTAMDPFANFSSNEKSNRVNNAYQNAMQIARGVKQ